MRLTFELPTKYLRQLSKLTDLDFALAQNCLEDPKYAEFFKSQSKAGRMVICDNGAYELGHSLPIAELEKVFAMINPSFIVSPDKLGDPEFTFKSFEQFRKKIPKERIAVCMAGRDEKERQSFFMNVAPNCDMLCLPFREPRKDWFTELLHANPRGRWPRYLHLFGMSTYQDLIFFSQAPQLNGWSSWEVSLDTAKPIKWGMEIKEMSSDVSPRGSKVSSATLHKEELTDAQVQMTLYNIAYLRRFCS
jgi:hypothetical protein